MLDQKIHRTVLRISRLEFYFEDNVVPKPLIEFNQR